MKHVLNSAAGVNDGVRHQLTGDEHDVAHDPAKPLLPGQRRPDHGRSLGVAGQIERQELLADTQCYPRCERSLTYCRPARPGPRKPVSEDGGSGLIADATAPALAGAGRQERARTPRSPPGQPVQGGALDAVSRPAGPARCGHPGHQAVGLVMGPAGHRGARWALNSSRSMVVSPRRPRWHPGRTHHGYPDPGSAILGGRCSPPESRTRRGRPTHVRAAPHRGSQTCCGTRATASW